MYNLMICYQNMKTLQHLESKGIQEGMKTKKIVKNK